MPLIRITHFDYIDPEAVAGIHTESTFTPDDSHPGTQTCTRVTEFKSHAGTNLLVLRGKGTLSTGIEDKNLDLKVMHAIQDEAIAAVRERRDARDSSEISAAAVTASQSR